MRHLVRIVVMAAVLAMTMSAGTAFAGHMHWLQTPGTCVADIASGQTSQTDGGGFHRFHDNVHAGTPGTAALDGPVTVGKSDTGTCP